MTHSAPKTSAAAGLDGLSYEELQVTAGDDEPTTTAAVQASSLVSAPRAAAAALGAVCLLGCVVGFAVLSGAGAAAPLAPHHASSPLPPSQPLTVRALLEGAELRDVTTENLIAMHKDSLAPEGVDSVREHVAQHLQDISKAIKDKYPEEHKQMDALQVSPEQKQAAFRMLKHFGDPRMVRLAHAMNAAAKENADAGGDREALARRLSDKLQGRMAELQQLSEEMNPGQGLKVDLQQQLPKLGDWHPELQVDVSREQRRLAAASDIEGGVHAHAQTLLESMHRQLGASMPTAPARMLSLFGSSSSTSPSSDSSSSSSGEDSFMTCMTKAVPVPTKVCKCIQDHMPDVMGMMMKFMKGSSR